MAIMGASGAGKTTLLNMLNFRNRGNLRIAGDVRINNRVVKSVEDISSVAGYVQQEEIFIGYLTVYEHLLFQVNQ
jgi:ABC-type multidrug transport system ATPase subunit